ncbi:MAG: VanW family protein [Clostridiaceae bacterium]|jgi:vancomycin resistance protein YoaR|nr:VanW family protein [Clostridiaceae bacterium]
MQRYIGCLFCVAVVFILSGCFSEKSIDEQTPMQDTITLTPTVTPVPTEAADKNEISSYTTIFYDKNENRISNIKTASEELNHTVIYPDEVFSFNEVLGKRTKDKGYKEAPILSHGEKAKGTGGGICQISSTLYNAALLADMEIVERHRHSKKVPYVPEGKDATVVYNSKDLKFKNTKDYPVEIVIKITEDEIRISLVKKEES